MITPVVLCGGAGTRLWPMSRKSYPKQFSQLLSKESLYQSTLRRFSSKLFDSPLIVTNDDFRFLAIDQAADVGLSDVKVVVEPTSQNTAPAVLIAALALEEIADALMLIAPCDHFIDDTKAFHCAISNGIEAAHKGAFVTFGVAPDRPEIGYGYLELELTEPQSSDSILPLKSFREKPDLASAKRMLELGGFLWNSGIVLCRASDVIDAYKHHEPDMFELCKIAFEKGTKDLGFLRLDRDAYTRVNAVSFDYAIMERAARVVTVPVEFGWSDLGSWDTLWRLASHDGDGNSVSGSATAIACKDSYIRSEAESIHLVGLGLESIIAVALPDAVLVADKARSQDVKMVVNQLRLASIDQAENYPRFHRPWGWYETLCLGGRFQVKRIMVKPGGELSLQSHFHRSEHWIVVAGTAEVTIGQEKRLIAENESVYVPLGATHRMKNPGRVPMYLIEVQTGSYLGEDDIVRYEDLYNR